MMKKIRLLCISIVLSLPLFTTAQIMYGIAGGGGNQFIIRINAATCETCPVQRIINDSNISDLAVLPNGNIITVGPFAIRVYDPPSAIPISTLNTAPSQFPSGVTVSASGTVYVSGDFGLGIFNPVSNTYTPIGPFPAAFPAVSDLFYDGTQLMGVAAGPCLVVINVTNPSLSTLSTCVPPIDMTGTSLVLGSGLLGANTDLLFSIDPATGNITSLCDFTVLPYGVLAIEYVPPSIPMPGCLCLTNAGTVASTNLTRCTNQTVSVAYNGNATLEADDVLSYILFSNPSDTLGSIIAQNATGVFAFDPVTMQTGVTYYLATIAGNNLSGSPDPNDPCLDFSNAATVVWRPTPAVGFTVANASLCAGDCRTVTATFTGVPPFVLTYTAPGGTFTRNFSGNVGTFQVCAPAGTPPGPLTVQATNLTDAWCTCN
jgi:hypothetical protein